jgi:hypothetical protein
MKVLRKETHTFLAPDIVIAIFSYFLNACVRQSNPSGQREREKERVIHFDENVCMCVHIPHSQCERLHHWHIIINVQIENLIQVYIYTWTLDRLMRIIISHRFPSYSPSPSFFFTSYFFQFMRPFVCALYVNLLSMHIYLTYYEHQHRADACHSLFLSFSSIYIYITLNCEVLEVCQERIGNTSVPFFFFFLSLFLSNMLSRLQWTNSMISFEWN